VADDIDSKVRSFELGAVDFVSKPFASAEVLARVKTHLQVARLQASLRNKVNELERAYDHIQELSTRDFLTGLYNRRYIDEQLRYLLTIAKRYEHPLSVAMIDIDYFKTVNDHFSHAMGDQVLSKVAELLQQGRRGTDLVGRYGGEEFIVVLPETSILDAAHSCEASRQIMERYPWDTFAAGLHVTISVGLGSDIYSLEGILTQADAKLYEAKHAGRNRVMF
jgi:diguanylate cyclase (GGDEF)-like protein